MGETLNNYVTRRRLEKSANLLVVKPQMTITDIAYDCGFSSSANFAKAFKKYFGYSATDVRKPNQVSQTQVGEIVKRYGKSFEPQNMYPKYWFQSQGHKKSSTEINLERLNSKSLCILSSDGGYTPEALFSTWNQLVNWGESQGIVSEKQYRLAFCFDNPAITPIEKCRYHAAIVVDETVKVLPPFAEGILLKGLYATLYVKGSVEDINDAQMAFYSDWLPSSGYEPDDYPMLERYLNDSREDGYTELEIMIKLKAASH